MEDIPLIPDVNLTRLNTKLRSTRERYSKIHVACKHKTIIDRLSKNQSIYIMKQKKRYSVVVMDR